MWRKAVLEQESVVGINQIRTENVLEGRLKQLIKAFERSTFCERMRWVVG